LKEGSQGGMTEQLCLDVTRSINGRKWTYRHDTEVLDGYASKTGLPLLKAALLLGRGVPETEIDRFLNPTLKNSLPNPSDILDTDKAAKLILDYIAAGKRITLFSDYDVDGGTAQFAMLSRYAALIAPLFGKV